MKAKRETSADRVFHIFCYLFLLLILVIIIIPLANLLAISFSSSSPVMKGEIRLLPQGFHTSAYQLVFSSGLFYTALGNTAFVTVMGTLLSVATSVLTAYALSIRKLPGRRALTLLFLFTMVFNGGMIPTYILMQQLGLLNSLWGIILAGTGSVYNILILKSSFEDLPASVEEAARIDGASRLYILFKIVLPISIPTVITICMFYAVTYWNDYINPKLYITQQSLLTLQTYLRSVIFDAFDPMGGYTLDTEAVQNCAPQTIINATIVAAILPIAIVYPFLQKYFTHGIMLGSVKE